MEPEIACEPHAADAGIKFCDLGDPREGLVRTVIVRKNDFKIIAIVDGREGSDHGVIGRSDIRFFVVDGNHDRNQRLLRSRGRASCTEIGDVHRKVRNPDLAGHPYRNASARTSDMLDIGHGMTPRCGAVCTGSGDPV
jgi:hypothetical protein